MRNNFFVRFLKSLLFFGLLSMVLLLACGTQRDVSEGAETEDGAALIWDVWEKIDGSYAGQGSLDPDVVVSGALRYMLDLTEAPAYPFLTEVGRLRGQVVPGVPEEMADVWRGLVLHQQRWPDIDPSELISAAINGLIDGLDDPTAAFLNAETYLAAREVLNESLEGTYLGIGARVIAQDGQILLFPFQGSPAEKAGIQQGDSLLEVQGETTAGKSLEEVLEQVVGPEGTKVTLLMERSGEPEPLELAVFRDNISLQSVTRQLVPGGIGYIYVSQFRDNTGEQVYDAIEALKQVDMLALILDLRSNPGGSENAASDVTGQFLLPGSLFIYQEDRNGERREQLIRQDLDRIDLGELPMVVLVNGNTKGEAEAVAAVLQETGLAVVMGIETFGKGATYNLVELDDGSAIYIPTLRWYTPSGKPLGGGGVQPDVWVDYQSESEGFGGESQFNRAYDYLNDKLPPFR
jgi:carboxyl-terminal processing protease